MNRDEIVKICSPFSLISSKRFHNNMDAIQHVETENVQGDIVEIGVYKGGSILSMMLASEAFTGFDRKFHLYDTFQGMTSPKEEDVDFNNVHASKTPWGQSACRSSLEEVKANIGKHTKIVPEFHVGDILLNTFVPHSIAVLRLDTDWYESTRHELQTFYPSVSKGGVVIIDDYGHWMGCRKAVDEFLQQHPNIELHEVDYTGRYFFKP